MRGGISMNEDPPSTSLNGPPSQSANVVSSAPYPSHCSVPGGIPMNKDPPTASFPSGPPSHSANVIPSPSYPSHHSVPDDISMNEDPPRASIHNGPPSRSANVIPSTPHPSHHSVPSDIPMDEETVRPLALPPAIEDIINQVVGKHLDAATAGLVEPTVQAIVDGCIPCLTEFMNSYFATLHAPKSNSASRLPEGTKEDCDGNDEDEDSPSRTFPRRKKPGPQGRKNCLHSPKTALPPLASINAIQAFNQNSTSPSTLDNITMDWCYSPLKSLHCNSEVIMLLSVDFHRNLKNGTYPDVALSFLQDLINGNC
ncbi:hypothetical protein OG21DRAFT_1527231 [Imleria badia]|nr:hypothetical protein OG21DRAFT_1527231 [Imleria badia]